MNAPAKPLETFEPKFIEQLSMQFSHALQALSTARAYARSVRQTEVFQVAETLLRSDAGLALLYERAHEFEEVGVFAGGPWADRSKLQPRLVAGSLEAGGVYTVVETLSELRLLAVAKGRLGTADEAEQARRFLEETMAVNSKYLFPKETESRRAQQDSPQYAVGVRLFALLAEELSLVGLLENVVREIDEVCTQRPIQTRPVRSLIDLSSRIPQERVSEAVRGQWSLYTRAGRGPSALCQEYSELPRYRKHLELCEEQTLVGEARAFSESLAATGIASAHHAVLLRHLRLHHPQLLPVALGLNELGTAELAQNVELVQQLIRVAVLPSTAQCIYGLGRLLEFGLLSRQEVSAGLMRLVDLDILPDVRRALLRGREKRDGATANSALLAGAISVFGQPLGIGQGRNPTCQAARAISLWAQHAHGYLLEQLVSAARDGFIEVEFEGELLRSNTLTKGLAMELQDDLDPVSTVLVPHLDKLYDEMMRRVALRHEDGHKWVNPALYGRWVPSGFASVFADRAQTTVTGYDEFVRRFFATHHPSFNEGYEMMYPNPVGVLVTNADGDYLGPHAVSLQRVECDQHGDLRAYFFNPNNEGRQDWGKGVRPSIRGHGEREGESSLPMDEFCSRLYAFHFNPYEEGDAYAVPDERVAAIERAARESWGRSFVWTPPNMTNETTP